MFRISIYYLQYVYSIRFQSSSTAREFVRKIVEREVSLGCWISRHRASSIVTARWSVLFFYISTITSFTARAIKFHWRQVCFSIRLSFRSSQVRVRVILLTWYMIWHLFYTEDVPETGASPCIDNYRIPYTAYSCRSIVPVKPDYVINTSNVTYCNFTKRNKRERVLNSTSVFLISSSCVHNCILSTYRQGFSLCTREKR